MVTGSGERRIDTCYRGRSSTTTFAEGADCGREIAQAEMLTMQRERDGDMTSVRWDIDRYNEHDLGRLAMIAERRLVEPPRGVSRRAER